MTSTFNPKSTLQSSEQNLVLQNHTRVRACQGDSTALEYPSMQLKPPETFCSSRNRNVYRWVTLNPNKENPMKKILDQTEF